MLGWMTRDEVLAELGIRPQTLYAYVSRGLVMRQADPADPRRSLYRHADIITLRTKRDQGKRAAAIAASTIAWGEPIITTYISTATAGRLYYRGQDAVQLAEGASLEETAQILWNARFTPRFEASKRDMAAEKPGVLRRVALYTRLAEAAAMGAPTLNRPEAVLLNEAQGLVGLVAAALGAPPDGEAPVHVRLAGAWGLKASEADLIRRALVLRADQELNTSTFAARVAASTGAGLGSCLLAGLSALSGPLHGDAADRIAAVMDEAGRTSVARTIERYVAAGREVPGFDHRLYPDGDPRAKALAAAFPAPAMFQALADAVESTTGQLPNLDFTVAALVHHLGLPDDTPFCLFVMARSVGWIAHAVEQVSQSALIRPRARYAGPTVLHRA